MKKYKNLFLVIITAILIIVFTPVFGNLYERLFGPVTSGFFGPVNPQYIDGFFFSYAFFVTFIVILFVSQKKYRSLEIALGLIFLLDIFLGAWEGLIINIGVALIAWLLAEGILLIKNKAKSKKLIT